MEKIKDTIFKFLRLETLVESVSGYIETRVQLVKLEIREEVVKVLSRGIILIAISFLAVLFLLFVSIGLAQYLNSIYADAYTGYWMVAGGYGVGLLIVILLRKPIDRNFEKHLTEIIKRKEH
jgi:Protein of unknown function (DUF1469).